MTAVSDGAAAVRLVERIGDWRSAELVIDWESGLVRNVALAGLQSKNGYQYTEEALRKAAPLYADKPVFLDHSADLSKPQERSTRDLAGHVVNPRFADGRIRGDIQTLGTEAGRTFLALADSGSGSVGMSHVVLVTQNRQRTLVEEIHEVVSVDAVTFPATTSSLSEQTGDTLTSPPLFGSLESSLTQIDRLLPGHARQWSGNADVVCERVAVFPRDVIVRVGEAEESCQFRIAWRMERGRVRLSEEWDPLGEVVLGMESWRDFSGGDAEVDSEIADELKASLEQLEEEKQALLAEVSELTAERELAARLVAVERMLVECELPEEAITETFRGLLLDAGDDETRAALLADRVELYERLRAREPVSCLRSETDEDVAAEAAILRLLSSRQ